MHHVYPFDSPLPWPDDLAHPEESESPDIVVVERLRTPVQPQRPLTVKELFGYGFVAPPGPTYRGSWGPPDRHDPQTCTLLRGGADRCDCNDPAAIFRKMAQVLDVCRAARKPDMLRRVPSARPSAPKPSERIRRGASRAPRKQRAQRRATTRTASRGDPAPPGDPPSQRALVRAPARIRGRRCAASTSARGPPSRP